MTQKTYAEISAEIAEHMTALMEVPKHRQELRALLKARAEMEGRIEAFLDLDFDDIEADPVEAISEPELEMVQPQPAQEASAGDNGQATNQEIREWAKSKRLTVPVHGKIPTKVRRAYEIAHQSG